MCCEQPTASGRGVQNETPVLSDYLRELFSGLSCEELARLMDDVQKGRVSIPIVVEIGEPIRG